MYHYGPVDVKTKGRPLIYIFNLIRTNSIINIFLVISVISSIIQYIQSSLLFQLGHFWFDNHSCNILQLHDDVMRWKVLMLFLLVSEQAVGQRVDTHVIYDAYVVTLS